MRHKIPFVPGEIYHLYNRGVDKRPIFMDIFDLERFFSGILLFNTTEPIGSIYEKSFEKPSKKKKEPLVELIAYCLNQNHYHLLVKEREEGGISEFMKRLSGGYTGYFNNRYQRSGVLFQGGFKSRHINSNEYLLHVSAYVNLNNRAHQLGGRTPKLMRSSWDEYVGYVDLPQQHLCEGKDIILEQFASSEKYRLFAEDALQDIIRRKKEDKELTNLLLE